MKKYVNNVKMYVVGLFVCGVMFVSWGASADIYFNAKVYGPVTNIYAINKKNKIEKITENIRWKDIDHDISKKGDIVFTSNRTESKRINLKKTSEVYDVYIQTRHGGELRKLTNTIEREYSPKFSPKGHKIAYLKITKSKFTELRLMGEGGENDTLLAIEKNIFDFDWSPDANEIAYSVGSDKKITIDVININSGKVDTVVESNVSDGKVEYLTSPTWSKDGKRLAYVTHPNYKQGQKSLYVVDIKTKATKCLSQDGMQVQSPVEWSADGQRILYSALVGYKFHYDESLRDKVYEGGMQVYLSDIKGQTTQLTDGQHFHGKPVFSPDESKVAYLFSEKLGGAYSYSLLVQGLDDGVPIELYKNVQRESKLIWR